jgi:hypothetical protein
LLVVVGWTGLQVPCRCHHQLLHLLLLLLLLLRLLLVDLQAPSATQLPAQAPVPALVVWLSGPAVGHDQLRLLPGKSPQHLHSARLLLLLLLLLPPQLLHTGSLAV